MENRRLLFRVILKSLFFVGLFVLIAVFVNSLFTNQQDNNQKVKKEKQIATVAIDISDMRKGEIRKVRWGVKEAAVLYRQFTKKAQSEEGSDSSKDTLHKSLSTETRSIKPEYFVFINHGDSGNCPLYYAKGEFNDTCSKNVFDENGLPVFPNQLSYQLTIPPHYFDGNLIKIGAWE
ncbi:hypothetical protein GCM10009133_19350 [Cocleimonas flava]|uniref:Uncharacterized protein n=1 Tax=Cocleimonas flava TaxID=634765 RepID=A0A4R1EY86_9GAMM|nr:hypothetical protein [Cocleimonas flava]TCJ84859.1 hypothetical protein EV695_2822 [Cocleimonas flava]